MVMLRLSAFGVHMRTILLGNFRGKDADVVNAEAVGKHVSGEFSDVIKDGMRCSPIYGSLRRTIYSQYNGMYSVIDRPQLFSRRSRSLRNRMPAQKRPGCRN